MSRRPDGEGLLSAGPSPPCAAHERGVVLEPITQGLLGAAVAGVVAPSLGRRALLWGALVGMSPDLDVLLAPLHGGFGELLYHRGTTHSLWFGFVAGPALGWLLWVWRDPGRTTPLRDWVAFCVLALVTHPILDGFTPYGTQFFAPFDRTRFAFHGVGIIDPFYTTILAFGVMAARRSTSTPALARRITATALALSSLYLLAGVGLNEFARADLQRLAGPGARIQVYPTLLQPFLRRVVLRDEGQVRVGWHSTFRPGCPWWETFPEPTTTPQALDLLATWEGGLMRWFAMDDVVLRTEPNGDGGSTVWMEDLRYGLPGLPPDQSMWGVTAHYDQTGRRLGGVTRFRRQRSNATLSGFGSWVWGEFRGTGLRGEHPARCGADLSERG